MYMIFEILGVILIILLAILVRNVKVIGDEIQAELYNISGKLDKLKEKDEDKDDYQSPFGASVANGSGGGII